MSAAARTSALVALTALLGAAGCAAVPYDPAKATRPYPFSLHTAEAPIDVQVFRHGGTLTFYNATLESFDDVDLWINQRFLLRLDSLGAGERVSVDVRELWDRWGNGPIRGGLLRRAEPTPIRMAELQVDETTPLIGLIVIRPETAER